MTFFLRLKSYLRSQSRLVTILFSGAPFRKLRNRFHNTMGHRVHMSANIMHSAFLNHGKIKIGRDTFVGDEVLITGGDIAIGRCCDIAPRVTIHAGSHIMGDASRRAGAPSEGLIRIGSGTWIGTGATIIAGAVIGTGSLVAAGSLVKRGRYPPNSLLAGCPAKVVKQFK